MAMLRHRRRAMPDLPMRLVYAVRSAEDVTYADELGDDAVLTFTRDAPAGWTGRTGCIDPSLLAGADIDSDTAFVCGPTGSSSPRRGLCSTTGVGRIRTEPFGPTG